MICDQNQDRCVAKARRVMLSNFWKELRRPCGHVQRRIDVLKARTKEDEVRPTVHHTVVTTIAVIAHCGSESHEMVPKSARHVPREGLSMYPQISVATETGVGDESRAVEGSLPVRLVEGGVRRSGRGPR